MKILKFIIFSLLGTYFIHAQEVNLDWHRSNIGPISQLITNMGHFGTGMTDYTGQFGAVEYPVGSFITYGTFAPWIAAKRGKTKLVTTGGPWNGSNNDVGHFQNRHELFPTAESWDNIWVVNSRESVDIPYWPGYKGVSDQDLVSRYNDYTIPINEHEPMDIEIIQVTYAWTSLEFLVHQFWITPKVSNLKDIHIGLFTNIGIGKIGETNKNDSYASFDEVNKLGMIEDNPGGFSHAQGPIAFRIFLDLPEDSLNVTWTDRNIAPMSLEPPPSNDIDRYDMMSTYGIYHDPLQFTGYGYSYHGWGPVSDLAVGDTLHFTLAQIMGIGVEGMYENYQRFLTVKEQDYHMPAPPPMPPVRFEVANHQVTLRWDPQPGDVDPEIFTDEYRLDGEPEPFEGYRVYKSYKSSSGPWTLLAEFDRNDDDIGNNTGLEYSFTDVGLLNNLEYYYTVTGFSKEDTVLNYPSQESSTNANSVLVVPGTAAPETVGKVAVVPNPYRGDQKYYSYKPAWEKPSLGETWIEEDRRIQFINLPNPCKITIFTVSGKYVSEINHNDPARGFEDWNLTSHVGQTIASGIYLFTVEDLKSGDVQVGKFVVIK
jgi:hypothetical protein